jgi:CDP-6-deoxy-D-xylo-4-hexulose-3-dehydrase
MKYFYPLLENTLSKEDLLAGINVIKSEQLTMSKKTKKFEKDFAKKIGAKYALMVNSGSSANLLATFAAGNPLRKNRFKAGDEALIPSVCWPTSLWPLIQAGLKPKFIDVEKDTLNVDPKKLISSITKKTRVIMLIHVLGNSTDIEKVIKIAKKKKIIIIEDTCESLGSKFKKRNLGTYGDFGTYSFYFSHQITSGEGGMVVCNDINDYNILYSMRAHGWSRGVTYQKKIEKKYKHLDPRFIFINSGFNLRPTDITAAIGHSQFKKLNNFINIRNYNRNKIISSLKKSKQWNNQFSFFKINKNVTPSFFGFPVILNKRYLGKRNNYLKKLSKDGVESRPIISGNFLRQPVAKTFKLDKEKNKFKNADEVQNLGFFIGLHTKKIKAKILKKLVKALLKI